MQFDKEGYIVSGSTPTPEFPALGDEAVAEIVAFYAQMDSLIRILRSTYPYEKPSKHEIGHSLDMLSMLAHDVEYNSRKLYERYTEALAAEIEAQNELTKF